MIISDLKKEWAWNDPDWLRFTHGEDLGYFYGRQMLQKSEWHPIVGNDCPAGDPNRCKFTKLQVDLAEFRESLDKNPPCYELFLSITPALIVGMIVSYSAHKNSEIPKFITLRFLPFKIKKQEHLRKCSILTAVTLL